MKVSLERTLSFPIYFGNFICLAEFLSIRLVFRYSLCFFYFPSILCVFILLIRFYVKQFNIFLENYHML